MANPTTLSPNVGNLQVGKGKIEFKKTGSAVFRHVGNVSELVATPETETLEHFSSMEGTRKKDLVITLEQKATLKMTMEEFTPENLAMMVQGEVDFGAAGGPEVEIFGASAVTGHLRFTGTNDVGPKITADFYNVSFTPSGDLGFISDEFNNMEVTGDVLADTATSVAAQGTLTFTTVPADLDTVTIGATVYTFKDTLASAYDVKRDATSIAKNIGNLKAAINASGTAGVEYFAGTLVHPSVSAEADGLHLYVTALAGGTAGNSIASTETGTGSTWGGATLAGGAATNPTQGKFGVAKFTNTTVN